MTKKWIRHKLLAVVGRGDRIVADLDAEGVTSHKTVLRNVLAKDALRD